MASSITTASLVAAAVPDGVVVDLPTILALGGIVMGGGGLVTVLFQIWGKRVKTPADRQAEVEYGTRVLQQIIEQQNIDKTANDGTILTLRDYVERLEKGSRDDQELIGTLQTQIRVLEGLNDDKERLIRRLRERQVVVAAKIRNNEEITLRDIFGDEHENAALAAEEERPR